MCQHKIKTQNYIQEKESIKVSVEIVESMAITEVNVYTMKEILKGVSIGVPINIKSAKNAEKRTL